MNCYVMYPYCKVYVFKSLCMFRSGYSVSLSCSVYCLCVNVYCTTATGVNSIVINKYHINPSGRTMVLGSTQPLNKNEYQEYFL